MHRSVKLLIFLAYEHDQNSSPSHLHDFQRVVRFELIVLSIFLYVEQFGGSRDFCLHRYPRVVLVVSFYQSNFTSCLTVTISPY